MSEPSQPPTPPPVFASYPRAGYAQQVYGTSEKLWRLYRGYHGMSWTFLLLVLSIVGLVGVGVCASPETSNTVLLIAFLLVCVAAGVACLYMAGRSGGDIGYGQGWSTGLGIFLGILAVFVGVILIAILQYLAMGEMRRYGVVPRSFGGLKKKVVLEKIEELKAYESGSQPMAAPATS